VTAYEDAIAICRDLNLDLSDVETLARTTDREAAIDLALTLTKARA
jgi:hypothetical protein